MGDTVVLYTDGVTEARNAQDAEFTQKGLIRALRRRKKLGAKATVDAVLQEVQKYGFGEQEDDITLIVARCTG